VGSAQELLPTAVVTRDQMSVFIVQTFHLPTP